MKPLGVVFSWMPIIVYGLHATQHATQQPFS